MKFTLALGLLFAGLAHSQLSQPKQSSLDTYIRESQHLKPTAQLVSIKEKGPISTVTYQDGPVNFKYDVKSNGNDMQIVGIEQMLTVSSNFQFNPSKMPKPTIQIEQLPPLPLMMPQFGIQANGQIQMRNMFDRVEKQMMEMEQRMEQNRMNAHQNIERKRQQIRENIQRRFNQASKKETPLIGGGDHDFNWATEIKIQPDQPLIGGGDHDMNWATIQFQKQHPLIGGGDHDAWQGQPVDFQAPHPIVGGDGHDNWQNKKKRCHKNLKNEENAEDKKHMGMKHHRQEGKQKRHHSNAAWMNRQFSVESVTPYLTDRLPDLMSESIILSVEQKGFEKGKGFQLDIQFKDKQGELQNVSAHFKPMKKEFSIEKISKVKPEPYTLQMGKEIIADVMKNIKDGFMKPAIEIEREKIIQNSHEVNENLIALKEIPEEPKPLLLGGKGDPDHEVDFTKMPKEIQVHQNNHISENKGQQIYLVPLLGGETDPDHVEQHIEVIPGGKSDPDQQFDETTLNKALKIVEDILEQDEVQDIDSTLEDVKEQVQQEKRSEIKDNIQLSTHRR